VADAVSLPMLRLPNLLLAGSLLLAGACASKSPRLPHECEVVFGSRVTSAQGTCTGPFKPVAVFGIDCPKGGPRLMLAKTWHGDDYAWGKVGSDWHILLRGQTVAAPVESCIGH
jgi:hypothetical protein